MFHLKNQGRPTAQQWQSPNNTCFLDWQEAVHLCQSENNMTYFLVRHEARKKLQFCQNEIKQTQNIDQHWKVNSIGNYSKDAKLWLTRADWWTNKGNTPDVTVSTCSYSATSCKKHKNRMQVLQNTTKHSKCIQKELLPTLWTLEQTTASRISLTNPNYSAGLIQSEACLK